MPTPARDSSKSAAKKTPGRRPGRPAGANTGVLDRATVLSLSLQLTRTVPLADLSVVLVARELGVTPGLIHYYLGGRGPLTSGVMNAFWRELIESWPREDGSWIHNLENVANALYRALLRYPGIASYVASHNRYRMVQDVQEGETDYGILFFEKFTTTMRQAGFDALRTAAYAHLVVELVTSYAHATVARRWPGQHGEFLNEKLAQLDPKEFPGTHFVRESLTSLNASDAYTMGLRLMLQALEVEQKARA
ncbi:MAG: TetR/AcrR family transcriptional regulator C-terminal domain-containing protein [Pseudomonadota bacterium]